MSLNTLTDFLTSVVSKVLKADQPDSGSEDGIKKALALLEEKRKELLQFKNSNDLSEKDEKAIDDLLLFIDVQRDLTLEESHIDRPIALFKKIHYLQKKSQLRMIMPNFDGQMERLFACLNDSIETRILIYATFKVAIDELRADTKADQAFCEHILRNYGVHYEDWVKLSSTEKQKRYLAGYCKTSGQENDD